MAITTDNNTLPATRSRRPDAVWSLEVRSVTPQAVEVEVEEDDDDGDLFDFGRALMWPPKRLQRTPEEEQVRREIERQRRDAAMVATVQAKAWGATKEEATKAGRLAAVKAGEAATEVALLRYVRSIKI